jgi:hypothetical protein
MLVTPIPKLNAHIHEAICAGVAPSDAAAEKIIAAELENPTSTATKPAITADGETSRQNDGLTVKPYRPRLSLQGAVLVAQRRQAHFDHLCHTRRHQDQASYRCRSS